MGKVIAVGSGKGGTGKTTTVAAVSSCLAGLGYRTICLDFDFKLSNLDFALSLERDGFESFSDVLSGKAGIVEACREHPGIPGLFFYSAGAGFDPENLDIDAVRPLFEDIRSNFDYCVVDAPSVTDYGFRLAHADADISFIVTTGELPAMIDVQRAASVALDSGVSDLRLLVNRCTPENYKLIDAAVEDAVSTAGVLFIGLVPEDKAVFQALHESVPLVLYKNRRAAYYFLDIARRLAGEAVPLRELQFYTPLYSPAPDNPDQNVSRKPLVPPSPRYVPEWPEDFFAHFGAEGEAEDGTGSEAEDEAGEPTGGLLKSRGDPELWAKSTLPPGEHELYKLYTIAPGIFLSEETIRHRTWLHDILDDNKIPYQIEIKGYWPTRRKFVEAQFIYIEQKNRNKAIRLIKEFNNPSNLVQEDAEEENEEVETVDGVPQKTCASCGKEIDFDYRKCPVCKGPAD